MNSGRVLPYLLLLLLVLGGLPGFIPTVSAVTVGPGVYFTCAGGLKNYTFHHVMNFSSITVTPSLITFNTTYIFMSDTPTWITLRRLDDNPLTTIVGDKVVEFDYQWTYTGSGSLFMVNGLKNSYNYRVTRNNVNWSYPVSDGSGTISFTTTLSGPVNIKIYDYAAPPADTTPPTITLNFAGNHSDKGGPYWLPPGETTALSGTNLNGYYTNNSYQNESWVYINASITDDIGVTSTKLHWHNETTNKWFNTTGLIKRNSNYYDYNTSVNITNISIGHKYSFDIYAYDAAGNTQKLFWNKTGPGATITRRYVHLKNPHSSMEYKILYLNDQKNYSIITDANKKDRFFFDQGTNNFGRDVGFLSTTVPTSAVKVLVNRDNVGGWYNNSSSITPFTLTNIYYHLWYSFENTQTSVDKIGWIKTRQGLSGAFTNYYTEQRSDNKSSISYNNGMGGLYSTDYLLSIHKLSTTSTSFTDNDIYEGELLGLSTSSHYISVASNRSFTTFLLLNVPSNATLNASYPDSDHDTLSDWMELYRSYTNPFLQDTDNDGFNDTVEYYGGSDPNNYTSTTPPAATAPSVLTNESTNVEETSAILNGWIASDGGADVTSAGFQYGTTTGYGTNLIIEQTADSFISSGGAYSDFSIYGIYRVAEKYTGFKGTPTISKFNLIQYGSPTGLCYSRIRYVSNDTIIMSVSADASLVSGWTTFSFPVGTYINSDIYVTFEYPGGSSSNFIRVDTGSPSGRNSYYYNGGWVLNTVAAQYIVFFSNLSFNHGGVFSLPIYGLTQGQLYHFRAFATNSIGTSYGSTLSEEFYRTG